MRIKIYRAPTLASAMAMVRAEMGADAFILATRSTSQGVELTASVEPREEPLAAPALPPLFARPAAGLTPATAGAQLAWHGVPAAIAARLAAGNLADSLRAELRFGALRLGAGEKPLLLAGLPGAGKTLTVARLATRLVLAGATPLVITADGRRAGAAEELAAYTRLLGINLMVASHPATLARALQQRGAAAPVLIDTSGANPFDAAELDAVAALAATAGAEAVLVAPAGQDPAEAADQAEAFAAVGITLLLPTRLDLARRLGGIVTAAMAGQLSLTEAGTGPSASDGLARLTPEFLAARLSRTPPLPGPNRQPAQAPHAPTRQR
jgi:flagellar biosynthesis protein FlhF